MKPYASLCILMAVLTLSGCVARTTQSVQGQPSAKPRLRPSPQPSPTVGPVSVRAERSGTTQVSIVVVGHGRTLYRILADSNDSRRASNGTYTSHFTNPTIVFFHPDGGQMRATARTADADGASKVVTLHNAVRVLAANGSVLTCNEFTYDQAHNHVHGWGHVVVTTKQGDTLRGENLTGDVLLRTVHIDG